MKLDLAVRNESERKRYHRSDNLRRIGEAVLGGEVKPAGKRPASCELSVLFCDDAFIAGLNKEYRNKTGPTDVLSFGQDFPNHGHPAVLGDIVISLETVERYCKGDTVAMRNEVRLLFCHGLLHLLGYNHATKEERETMNELQAQYLGVGKEAAWHARAQASKAGRHSRSRGGA